MAAKRSINILAVLLLKSGAPSGTVLLNVEGICPKCVHRSDADCPARIDPGS